jgi:branched-chain amino acid transport system ATP-binding protein
VISVQEVTAGYGRSVVLRALSLEVAKGEKVTILGPNGAGKTTLLKVIMGTVAPRTGTVKLEGQDITKLAPWSRVRLGLALVPEGRRVFTTLSIRENLLMGAYLDHDRGSIEANLDRVLSTFPPLRSKFRDRAGGLSGGQQQMLAIGRALMSNPRVLLLDEPSLGLAPMVRNQVGDALRTIAESGDTTIVIIEQFADVALRLTDRFFVIKNGRIALSGRTEDATRDALREAYLA